MKLENLDEANELAKDLSHIQYLIDSVNELDFSKSGLCLSDGGVLNVHLMEKSIGSDVQEEVRSTILKALNDTKCDLRSQIEKL